jgi:hypothetical protein
MTHQKTPIGSTYCYKNFITKEQQVQLLDWAHNSIKYMGRAKPVNNEENQQGKELIRHFVKLRELEYVPNIVKELRRIIMVIGLV